MRPPPLVAAVLGLLVVAAPGAVRGQAPPPGARTAEQVEQTRVRALARPSDAEGRAAVERWLSDLAAGTSLGSADAALRAAETVTAIDEVHCRTQAPSQPAFCAQLARVACDLERLAAERRVELADRGGDAAGYARAAEAYLTLAERPACPRRDELLYNAAKGFQAARDLPRAIRALETLADTRSAGAASPLVPQALAQLAGLHRSVGDFERAAGALERSVDVAPKTDHAPADLNDAVVLRVALGDLAAARKDTEQFAKLYGATRRDQTAALLVALAETFSKPDAAAATPGRELDALVERAVAVAERATSADLPLRAHALAARRHRAAKRDETAKQHARAVLALAARGALQRTGGDDDTTRMRSLGRALTALGEAHFVLAALDRDARPRPAAPQAPPRADDRALADYVPRRVAPWLAARLEEASTTERALAPILAIQPIPPPVWVVAAAGEVATSYLDIDDELERLAAALDGTGRKPAARAVRGAGASARAKAKGAALAYRSIAAKFQATSDHAARVDAWLSRRFAREHPPLDELVPRLRASWPGLPPPAGAAR